MLTRMMRNPKQLYFEDVKWYDIDEKVHFKHRQKRGMVKDVDGTFIGNDYRAEDQDYTVSRLSHMINYEILPYNLGRLCKEYRHSASSLQYF